MKTAPLCTMERRSASFRRLDCVVQSVDKSRYKEEVRRYLVIRGITPLLYGNINQHPQYTDYWNTNLAAMTRRIASTVVPTMPTNGAGSASDVSKEAKSCIDAENTKSEMRIVVLPSDLSCLLFDEGWPELEHL